MKKLKIKTAVDFKDGDNADVKRLFPVPGFRHSDPFVLLDHFFVHAPAGFPDHTHKGFEAISYITEGAFHHKDNLGNDSVCPKGGVQRFTAGRGITHSEMPGPEGLASGLQLWINLPKNKKFAVPDYQIVQSNHIPETKQGGAIVRDVIGGQSPLRLHTDVIMKDISLPDHAMLEDAVPEGMKGFLFLIEGGLTVSDTHIAPGQALFFDTVEEDDYMTVKSEEACRYFLIFGRPHHEPIVLNGTNVE